VKYAARFLIFLKKLSAYLVPGTGNHANRFQIDANRTTLQFVPCTDLLMFFDNLQYI